MDKIKFDTKKDWLGKTLLFGPTLVISTLTILKLSGVSFGPVIPKVEPLIIGSVGFWLFLILAWNFTYYTIVQTTLTARMALLRWTTIKIEDIKEIKSQEFGQFTFEISNYVQLIRGLRQNCSQQGL
jgi:hypothetical protein